MIYEPHNRIEVDTPKGRANIWLVTEYGYETEKVFTCIIKETGEIWEFTNKDIRATSNITFNRALRTSQSCNTSLQPNNGDADAT